MSRTCIIVSPYFPPSTLAGVHRARHLAKHLPAAGWVPTILCVDEACHEQRLDPALATLVPTTVNVVKVSALPARLCRPFGFGEISLRAWQPLRSALFRLLATRPIDAVLITGSPYYPMLLSGEIKRRFRVPVILDFQDPWVSVEGATRPKWSKGGVAHQLAVALEPRAVSHSSFITSVSDTQNAHMAYMYPWLDSSRMAAIPIGGDPEDSDALRSSPQLNQELGLDPERINLSYVGTFLPRAAPLVRQVFHAMRVLRETQPSLVARVRLNFVGTSNQPTYSGPGLVMPLAIEAGIADLVVESPQRVPFLNALGILANSDGLLLIGSDEPHYTASKIYPALMSGRPFLSLFHSASSAHQILSAAGGGRSFSFSDAGELLALQSELAKALFDLATQPESFGRADPAAYDVFTARSVARQFANVFDRVAGGL